jgi:hypothetical protein
MTTAEFKKGDKVKYLGHDAIISNVQYNDYTNAFLYSLKYKSENGFRSVSCIRKDDAITK